ncbi:MAG: hypothetical protein GX921_09195, partial [Bacteroidales bacterium]|nr:hypothetical protein [Bacteroidales bacterium]
KQGTFRIEGWNEKSNNPLGSYIPNLFATREDNVLWFDLPLGTTLEQAKTALTGLSLNYQLAEPIITPIDAKPITCYENGTLIIEPYIKDKFVVGETLTITLEYPVKAIDKLLKLNTETPEWVEVEGTLSEDGTTITVTEQGTYEVYGEIKPEYSTRAEKTFSVPINLKAQVNSNTDAIKKVNDKIYVDSELFTAMLLQQEMRITLSEQQTADHESRITTLENPTP